MSLEYMPDIVLLNILRFLNSDDLVNLSKCHDRLEQFCFDKLVVRNTSFEGRWNISEAELRKYIKKNGQYIQHLNLNHCYWLPAKTVEWIVSKCKDLRSLHVIECRIKPQTLANSLTKLDKLTALSFSVQSFLDLKSEVFISCVQTLSGLRKIHIFYSSRPPVNMHYLGEHHTLFNHCQHLEEIYIGSIGLAVHDPFNSSYGEIIPELYRPLLANPHHYKQLRSMCLTKNVHPGAQMLYYGLLNQMPNEDIAYEELVVPNVNFVEFEKKREYKLTLKTVNKFTAFDVSGSKVKYPLLLMNLNSSNVLQHLSLSTIQLDYLLFQTITSTCRHLRSLNLFGCDKMFDNKIVGDSVAELFSKCPHLKHLNIGGAHHHKPILSCSQAGIICSKIKGLRSLCISSCFLRNETTCASLKRPPMDQGGHEAKFPRTSSDCNTIGADLPQPIENVRVLRSSVSSCSSSSLASTSSAPPSKRVAHVKYVASENMETLVINNPELQELEIISPGLSSLIHANKFISSCDASLPETCDLTRYVQDQCLKPLTKLSSLQKLTVMGLPGVKSLLSLVQIAQTCSQLHYLALGYLSREAFGPIFCEALKHMQTLEDLRIENPHLSTDQHLFTAISHCKNLQRLCIVARTEHHFDSNAILHMFEKLPSLIAFHMFAGGTLAACKNLTNKLTTSYSKTRPALSVAIHPLSMGIADTCIKLPACHYMQLTRFEPRVAAFPLEEKASSTI